MGRAEVTGESGPGLLRHSMESLKNNLTLESERAEVTCNNWAWPGVRGLSFSDSEMRKR